MGTPPMPALSIEHGPRAGYFAPFLGALWEKEKENMDTGRRYIVTTHWGCFSLNEGAYRDYIAGKLWISWVPGQRTSTEFSGEKQALPPNVTKAALALRERAAKAGTVAILNSDFPGKAAVIPYKEYMEKVKVEDMPLNPRGHNALLRARIDTLGKLNNVVTSEMGLSCIRNVGVKTIKEITDVFMEEAYHRLSAYERAIFWQEMLDK